MLTNVDQDWRGFPFFPISEFLHASRLFSLAEEGEKSQENVYKIQIKLHRSVDVKLSVAFKSSHAELFDHVHIVSGNAEEQEEYGAVYDYFHRAASQQEHIYQAYDDRHQQGNHQHRAPAGKVALASVAVDGESAEEGSSGEE